MNIYRYLADSLHLLSFLILIYKLIRDKSALGISCKTQEIYLIVFLTRYMDLFMYFVSFYNTFMKITFITVTIITTAITAITATTIIITIIMAMAMMKTAAWTAITIPETAATAIPETAIQAAVPLRMMTALPISLPQAVYSTPCLAAETIDSITVFYS